MPSLLSLENRYNPRGGVAAVRAPRTGGGGEENEGGQKLDAAELNVAIKATRAKLEAIAGEDLKLPEVRESVEDILEKFDENNGQFLDKRFKAFPHLLLARGMADVAAAKVQPKAWAFTCSCNASSLNRRAVFSLDHRVRA